MSARTITPQSLVVLAVLTVPIVWLNARNADALSVAVASADWPTTPGEVTHFSRQEPRGDRAGSGAVRVTYTYQVDGQVYSSSRYDAGGHPGRDAVVPTPLIVRYDPARPASAVLVSGVPGRLWYQLGFGGLLGAFIMASWLYSAVSLVMNRGTDHQD